MLLYWNDYIYIYIYIYVYTNLPVSDIIRLPHPLSGDSQDQETFLLPSADSQTRNYDTKRSYIYISAHIYIYISYTEYRYFSRSDTFVLSNNHKVSLFLDFPVFDFPKLPIS